MSNRKAIFFDIDGTLLFEGSTIPQSTKDAVNKLRQNGHLTFLCTGRSNIMVPKILFEEMEFDGVVAACGMYGRFHDQVLFDKQLSTEQLSFLIPYLHNHKMMYILEGTEYIYYDVDTIDMAQQNWYLDVIKALGPKHFVPVSDDYSQIQTSKVSLELPKEKEKLICDYFSQDYDVMVHPEGVAEIVPQGADKAAGMDRMREYLKMKREDVIAVGDSINDISMLQYAGISISMGNGSNDAKSVSDYVTTGILEDGIWHAMKHFELI